MPRTKPPRALRVGDRVRLTVGFALYHAEVIEDRGNLGVNGRRILRVRLLDSPFEPPTNEFDWPADELQAERAA